jgi:hypothetical protein
MIRDREAKFTFSSVETNMDHAAEAYSSAAIIASIAFACAIYYATKNWFEHRERMAKIQQGINPDKPWPEDMASQPHRGIRDGIQKEIPS